MKTATTVYLRKEMKSRIQRASIMTGDSFSELFIKLIKKLMKNHDRLFQYDNSIQYQQHDKKIKWSRLHVSIWTRDYEYCLDMRKFCKRSVSLLCTMAVELYLDEIIRDIDSEQNKFEKGTDNYRFQHYIIQKETIDEVICWKIYWGIPYRMNNASKNTRYLIR